MVFAQAPCPTCLTPCLPSSAAFFQDCISEQDLDEMNIEIIRNTLYKVVACTGWMGWGAGRASLVGVWLLKAMGAPSGVMIECEACTRTR